MTSSETSVMTKIMKLLERAEHPETPGPEADACREKAEALMLQHQIDRMDLKPEEKTRIKVEPWEMRVPGNTEYASALRTLLETVLKHCGCRMNPKFDWGRDENGAVDVDVRIFKVVGFPEDISYAERIWFRVFKEFVSNLSPQWNKEASIEENAYSLAGAGIEWQQMVLMANRANDERIPVSEMGPEDWQGRSKPVKGNRPLIKGIKMLRDGYKAECERRGENYDYTKGRKTREAYRTSFARSYNSTIGKRLRVMREMAKETVSDSDKYALAVIDTKEKVDAEFYRLFPEFDPEVHRRKAEAMAAEGIARFLAMTPDEQAYVIAEEIRAERRWRSASTKARRGYARVRENPYDNIESAAWDRGRRVAEKVNLRDDGEVKHENKKGLR